MEDQTDLSGATPSQPAAQPVTDIPIEGVQVDKRKAQEIFNELIKVENVFKDVFRESLYINTAKVKKGGTSGYIYVPKHYIGHAVTVIIWDKPALEE